MPVQVTPADAELMRAYAAGEVRAFDTLYTRHEKRLWRFVLRSVGNPATADDLAQDVWLRVAQQAERYAPSASREDLPPARFTTWLFTIARNRVVDHLRASRHQGGCVAERLLRAFLVTAKGHVGNDQCALAAARHAGRMIGNVG